VLWYLLVNKTYWADERVKYETGNSDVIVAITLVLIIVWPHKTLSTVYGRCLFMFIVIGVDSVEWLRD